MADIDEGVVLTEGEREALAALAASIGDPWLAGQLVGSDPSAPEPKRPPAWRRSLPNAVSRWAVSGWIGPALLLVGAALAIAAFMHSTALAALGLAVMGVGLWRLVVDRGDDIVRRLTARRGDPDGTPPPPGAPPDGPPA